MAKKDAGWVGGCQGNDSMSQAVPEKATLIDDVHLGGNGPVNRVAMRTQFILHEFLLTEKVPKIEGPVFDFN